MTVMHPRAKGTVIAPRARASGFTVIELVIVVVIAGIMVALAMPNLGAFLKNNARATNLNALVGAVTYARSNAVSNNTSITVCASTNGATCSGTADFGAGFIVFIDTDGDTVVDAGDGDRLLRAWSPDLAADASLTGDSDGGPVTSVVFNGIGAAPGIGAGTHFRYCDDRGNPQSRAVELTASGQARLSLDSDGNGVDDVAGTDLSCA
jgi:type IV fimbrial biogenesis protein FimT